MSIWIRIFLVSAVLAVVIFAIVLIRGNRLHHDKMAEADAAWADILARTPAAAIRFDPNMLDGLPEIAKRYFNHAIKPGTLLRSTVVLHMDGTFLLGHKRKPRPLDLTAKQILAPPGEFVWIAEMRSGFTHVSGTDAMYQGHGWTRFWLSRSLPLVQQAATPDLDRSAKVRPVLESIWAPAALLPQNGARWEQIGPNRARVTVGSGDSEVEFEMELNSTGGVTEIVAQRWSDANPRRVYRLQAFGGTVGAEATFDGYTVPSRVSVGNDFGTHDYFPFFDVTIRSAAYK